jgi:CTP-dependent riboflavin kinase
VRAFGITTGASLREDLLPYNPHAVPDSLTQLHAHLAEAAPAATASPTVRGELVSGLGEASGFLAMNWVREAIEARLGGPFYPGTVNLAADPDSAALAARLRHDVRLKRFELAARDGFCPALLLWPQVPGYPDGKLELICPIPLRTRWALTDGAMLDVRYLTLEESWP